LFLLSLSLSTIPELILLWPGDDDGDNNDDNGDDDDDDNDDGDDGSDNDDDDKGDNNGDNDSDSEDDDDVYLRLQHGKGFHNLVYMSYVKHINPASKA
jgi:hypothetical protein